jgi:hypothetical protein
MITKQQNQVGTYRRDVRAAFSGAILTLTFISAFQLFSFSAFPQVPPTPVLFPIQSMFGGAAWGQSITITAANTLLTDGVNLYAGTFTVVPSTGTNPIIYLQPNSYLLTISGVRTPSRFTVPSVPYVTNVVSLITSGPLFWFGTNGFANLLAGTNIFMVTNADGSITINSSGGTGPTNLISAVTTNLLYPQVTGYWLNTNIVFVTSAGSAFCNTNYYWNPLYPVSCTAAGGTNQTGAYTNQAQSAIIWCDIQNLVGDGPGAWNICGLIPDLVSGTFTNFWYLGSTNVDLTGWNVYEGGNPEANSYSTNSTTPSGYVLSPQFPFTSLTVAGNVSANNLIGNGQNITNLTCVANVSVPPYLVIIGDSLSTSNGIQFTNGWTNYFGVLATNQLPCLIMTNIAIAGVTAVGLQSGLNTNLNLIPAQKMKVVSVEAGVNDMAYGLTNTVIAALSNIWRCARFTNNAKVMAWTITTNFSYAQSNLVATGIVNQWIMSASNQWDALVRPDLYANSPLNNVDAAVHWNATTSSNIAILAAKALQSILVNNAGVSSLIQLNPGCVIPAAIQTTNTPTTSGQTLHYDATTGKCYWQ